MQDTLVKIVRNIGNSIGNFDRKTVDRLMAGGGIVLVLGGVSPVVKNMYQGQTQNTIQEDEYPPNLLSPALYWSGYALVLYSALRQREPAPKP